ncbi:MAG: PEP/pyruvate-binding domain-containing protein [Promethearchaeota archaeon]
MLNKVSFIADLTQLDIDNVELGNKATNLSKLIQYNFSVPKGFVIKTNAYDEFVNFNNLDGIIQDSLVKIVFDNFETIETCSKTIQDSIENGEFPLEIVNELELKYREFSSYNVALRSSAIAEDLPSASFAGQYDTYLNLGDFAQILKYIKKCYASLWTSRAIVYRYKNKIPHEKVKIAVIVQNMIDAKFAGVLFTLNPITSKNNELLIESNYGLGESIVSGKSSPDQFFIQKLRRGSLKILNRRIGRKKLAAYPKYKGNDEGIEYKELSEELAQQSSLSDEAIIKIAKLGLQIEKKFNGISQDIEWAIDKDNRINILQTRPITAFKAESIPSEILWSRGYSDDYWNDNVTPLYFELLGDPITKIVNIELNDIMGYKQMDIELLKLYKAHVYFNLNVIKRKVENEIPKFIRNEDVLNYFPEGSGPYGKSKVKELPFHLISRIVAELRISSYDPNGSMSKTAEAYENWNQETFIPYCKKFENQLKEFDDLTNLIRLIEELDRIMIGHFRLIRYGIPVHNIGMNLLVQYLLTRFIGKEECYKLYPILISGLQNKLTETNDQIHNLSSLINKSEELKSIFNNQDSSEIYNILLKNSTQSSQNFLNEFVTFLNEHGVRGFTREIFYPRWKEPPMTNVFDILKSLIMDKWEELDTIKAKNLKKRELTEMIVEKKIRSQRFGLLKWKIFSVIIKNSRKYISFREDQRFNLDKWITMNRNAYLKIGKVFTERGIIPDENKIFFLFKREIKDLALGNYKSQEIQQISSNVIKRYEEFKRYENKIPPKFIMGSREFNDELKYNDKSQIFKGLPASQGTMIGPIRVIHDINLISTVRAGEILVVPQTDPGWTPVFSKIGGLITETGGILSHGAVVSREFGIPAVTNIINASKIFTTGQIVKINGYNGTVILQNLNERG